MKTNRKIPLLLVFIVIGTILLGCNLVAGLTLTPVPPGEIPYTQVAQTIEAQLTALGGVSSPMPFPSTLTPTSIPTLTPTVTPIPLLPTSTSTSTIPAPSPTQTQVDRKSTRLNSSHQLI